MEDELIIGFLLMVGIIIGVVITVVLMDFSNNQYISNKTLVRSNYAHYSTTNGQFILDLQLK